MGIAQCNDCCDAGVYAVQWSVQHILPAVPAISGYARTSSRIDVLLVSIKF